MLAPLLVLLDGTAAVDVLKRSLGAGVDCACQAAGIGAWRAMKVVVVHVVVVVLVVTVT